MALLLLDDLRPRRFRDQLFGLDLSPDDFLMEVLDRRPRSRHYARPWRNFALVAQDAGSTIETDKDKFQLNIDVQHFAPEEISVKTVDGFIVVEGKHEEKKDEHGYISREFKRRYALPEDCNPDAVESRLSSDGVLTVVAPRASENKKERAVPITHTGPVRRKHQDEEEKQIENGEEKGDKEEKEEKEEKSPQKKRRR